MSENDRMERAKRIRRMREGQRDGEEDSPETEDDTVDSDPETGDEEPTAADTNGTEDAAAASTDGGATAVSSEQDANGAEEAAERGDDAADGDGSIDAAVENVSGTHAELPSTEQMEAAMEQTMEQAEQVAEETPAESPEEEAETEAEADEPASPATGIAGDADQTKEADTRILEFTLDDEQYCLDIQYIEEIVKHTAITRVPNTPNFVEGVVDLRGQITTILNPKVTIGKPNKEAGDLIVVFDAEAFEDQGHIGWVVDDVRQVSPISEDDVNDPPMQEDYINGVIDRDDGEFVIWTTPDLALEEAE
jgi:purine-binding chemotaxis protein CheW